MESIIGDISGNDLAEIDGFDRGFKKVEIEVQRKKLTECLKGKFHKGF